MICKNFVQDLILCSSIPRELSVGNRLTYTKWDRVVAEVLTCDIYKNK